MWNYPIIYAIENFYVIKISLSISVSMLRKLKIFIIIWGSKNEFFNAHINANFKLITLE